MKKGYVISLALLVALSGGCKKKHKGDKHKKDIRTEVDIPTANDGIKSFFDEDINEFALSDDAAGKKNVHRSVNTHVDAHGVEVSDSQDYAWLGQESGPFKKVFFDFDKYNIREDQKVNLAHDIQAAKVEIEKAQKEGKAAPSIVVDGHACHSAGSRVYNLALSEKRAKVLADQLIEAGISPDHIKIVGRGSEMPLLVNGKPCEGNREQQAPNRRDELHVVYS